MLSRLAKQGYQLVLTQLRKTAPSNGFLLPVVIALGLGVGTISIVALQTVAQNSATLNTQYYAQVAREAAQAGVSAASTCIKTTNPVAATWTSSNTLTPDKDCTLTVPASNPPSAYIDDNSQFSSTYSVIKPTYQDSNNTSMLITSTGRAYAKIVGGARVVAAEVTVHGYGTFPSNNVIVPTNYKKVKEISTGDTTTCTVAEDDWAYCWGSNANGQLGIGKNVLDNRQTSPVAVASNTNPTAPIPGTAVSCGFFCTTYNPADTPAQPASAMAGKKVTKISVGSTHTCAVATDTNGSNGKAYCWGKNDNGQLGNYSTTDSLTPVAVDTTGSIPAIPAVPPSGCGFFGCSDPGSPAVPAKLASALQGKNVVDITAGNNFTCALTSDGKVGCWGANNNGQLGTGDRTTYTYPAQVDTTFAGTPAIPEVPAVPPSGCGWFGCTDPGSPLIPAVPAVPPSALLNKTVASLAELKGSSTMCVVVASTNDPVCWGQNYSGQVGDGRHGTSSSASNPCAGGNQSDYPNVPIDTSVDALRPTAVLGSTKFASFTVYDNYTTAISTTGRAYWWGGTTSTTTTHTICGSTGGNNGGAGQNKYINSTTRTYTYQSSPTGPLYNTGTTTINSASLALSSGNPKSGLFCASLSTNNQIYCDANGTSSTEGQTGSSFTPNCYLAGFWPFQYTQCDPAPTGPQPVTMTPFGGISISKLDTGTSGYTCAVTTDGQVFCWGLNTSGQLGTIPATNRNLPAPVDINQATSALYSNGAGNGSGTTNGAYTIRAVY
jgi:alpha-tubulin suppressor-like RCC1 family protein